jgi:hypothetical protein
MSRSAWLFSPSCSVRIETEADTEVRNYIAIAEPSAGGQTWRISFPGLPGITSATDGPEQIAPQARDVLASAVVLGLPTLS